MGGPKLGPPFTLYEELRSVTVDQGLRRRGCAGGAHVNLHALRSRRCHLRESSLVAKVWLVLKMPLPEPTACGYSGCLRILCVSMLYTCSPYLSWNSKSCCAPKAFTFRSPFSLRLWC